MARTQGKKIAIYDNGILLADSIDVLNFTGSGHSAAITSTSPLLTVTETISGGSGGTQVIGEVPSGSGTTFTLAHTPLSGTLQLYRGGVRQQSGAGNDYTISGTTITFSVTVSAGEILLADYQY